MLEVTYGDFKLSDILGVTSKFDRGIGLPRSNYLEDVNGLGKMFVRSKFDEKVILMPFILRYDLNKKRRELAAALSSLTPQKLIFSDEPDKYYMAIPNNYVNLDEINFLGKGTIEWLIPDGVAHAIDPKIYTMSDGLVTINNQGSYKTPIRWVVDFPSDCESFGLVTEDKIMEFGHSGTEDIDEDLSNTVLFDDPMKSSTSGQYSRNVGKIRWRNDSGENTSQVQGTLKYESDAITVDSYGPSGADDAFWHGPTLTRFFEPFSDGEVYQRFNFKPNGATKDKAKKQGLIELNFVDEDNNFVCGFEMKDNTDSKYQVEYKFYAGEAVIKSGFLPASVLSKNGGFFGMIRIKKVGNNFDFYLARLLDNPKGGFTESWKATHNWTNEEVAMLKPARVDMAMLNWRNKQPMYQSITHLRVTRYATRNNSLIPKTFNAGDQLVIEESGRLLLNGIVANGFSVIGTDYIQAEVGSNEIFFSYEGDQSPVVTATIEELYL